MMRLALQVEYNDGSGAEVTATAPDLIAFERHFDKPMSVFAENLRIEFILWLAWQSFHRRELTSLDFDPWCETVDNVTIGDVGDPVPLESNQPTG